MSTRKIRGGYEVRRELRETVASLDDARRLDALASEAVRRARLLFASGATATTTISASIEAYLAHARATRGIGPGREARIRRVLTRWSESLEDATLDRISPAILDRAVSRRLGARGYRGRPISRATVAVEVGILRAFGRWAAGPGRRASTDASIVSYRISAPSDMHHGGEYRSLPLDEYLAHASAIHARSPSVALVMFGVVAFGLRPGAIVRLTWSRVSLPRDPGSRGSVRPAALKGGLAGEVPAPYGSARHRLLLRLREICGRHVRPGDHVFRPPRSRAWTMERFCGSLRRHASALGLPAALTSYVGRHAAISAAQAAPGVGLSHVAGYAKHRNIGTQAVYAHGTNAEPALSVTDSMLMRAIPGDVFCHPEKQTARESRRRVHVLSRNGVANSSDNSIARHY